MSDHRLISWAVTSDKAKDRPQYKRRYLRGWNANKYVAALFQEALDVSPTAANSTQEEADEVMRRVASACDAGMARKRPNNDHLPMYWWNDNIAKSRQECIRARRTVTRARKKSNHKDLKDLKELHKEAKGSQMQMTVGKGKDRKVFSAGRHSGTAPKRADGPTSSSRG